MLSVRSRNDRFRSHWLLRFVSKHGRSDSRAIGFSQRIAFRPTTSQRLARRCQIILLRAQGLSQQQVAERSRVNRPEVAHWEKRFKAAGIEGLNEAPRSGRKPVISAQIKARRVRLLVTLNGQRARWPRPRA